MGCTNTKAKAPPKTKGPEQIKKDKYGRPMHRPRGSPFTQMEMLYQNMAAMAELSARDPDQFIKLTKQADVKDFSKYVGFDLASHRDIMLQSSRQILSTADWNPLTFSLLIHQQPDLRDYILNTCIFVPQMLAIGLPATSVANVRNWTEDELIDGQIKTLLLLVEDNSANFGFILNKFSHFLSEKLLRKLIPKVAQTENGP